MAQADNFSLWRALRKSGATLYAVAPFALAWAIPLVVLPYLGSAYLIVTLRSQWIETAASICRAVLWIAFEIAVIWASAETLDGRKTSLGGALHAIRSVWLAGLALSVLYAALVGLAGSLQIFFSFDVFGAASSQRHQAWFDALRWVAGLPVIVIDAIWIMALPARVLSGTVVYQAFQRSLRLFKAAPWSLLLIAAACRALEALFYTIAVQVRASAWDNPLRGAYVGASDLLGCAMAVFGTVVYLELRALNPRKASPFDAAPPITAS